MPIVYAICRRIQGLSWTRDARACFLPNQPVANLTVRRLFSTRTQADLQRKPATKQTTQASSHAGIRRSYRDDSRDRRHSTRRAAARLYGTRDGPASILDRAALWPETEMASTGSSFHAGNPLDNPPRPLREALREVARIDSRRGARMDQQMNAIFGTNWQDSPAAAQRQEDDRYESDLGWWSIESGNAARRARLVRGATVGSLDLLNSASDNVAQTSPPLHRARYIPEPSSASQTRSTGVTDVEALRQRAVADVGGARRRPGLLARARWSRGTRGRGLDGLGDRERSLSPEGWDTLLTTLTPDPQPPSANASFASAGQGQASQATAVSSATTVSTTTDGPIGIATDGPCDWDNSDNDSPDYEHPDFANIRRHREQQRLRRSRVPDFNAEAPTDRDLGFGLRVVGGDSNRPQTALRRGGSDVTRPNTDVNVSFADAEGRRDGWISRVLIGVAGEPGPDTSQPDPAPTANTSGRSDESEWTGMQQIIHSLARRQDIPDEWWAEAGLSRTISSEDAAN